jgi:hypothetical protein
MMMRCIAFSQQAAGRVILSANIAAGGALLPQSQLPTSEQFQRTLNQVLEDQ